MSGARTPAIAGIVFAASFVAGFLILGGALGNFGDSDRTFAEYYQKDRQYEIVGGYLLTVAAIAFVVFVAGVCAPSVSDGSRAPAGLAAIAASAVFAALLSAAAAALVTIPASRFFGGDIFGDEGQLVSEVSALPQLGYVLLFVPGVLFASMTLVCTSLVIRARPELPRWVASSGFAAAALLLLAVFFMPIVALPLWVLAASIAMLRSRSERQPASPYPRRRPPGLRRPTSDLSPSASRVPPPASVRSTAARPRAADGAFRPEEQT